MSKHKNGKHWSVTQLKRRGWTKALIRALLPEPRRIFSRGRPVPVWNRQDVLLAEQRPEFLQGRETWEPERAPARSSAPEKAQGGTTSQMPRLR